MPETDVPPWLHVTPDYFLNAIRSGSEAGLQRGRLLTEQQGQADRLQLAYDQMASENKRADEAAQAKLQLAQQAMALRQSNFDEQQALRQQHQEELGRYRDQMMDWRTKSEEDRARYQQADLQRKLDAMKQGKVHFGPQGEVLRENQDGSVDVLRERDPSLAKPKLSQAEAGLMHDDLVSLRDVNKRLRELGEPYGGVKNMLNTIIPGTSHNDKIIALRDERQELRKRIASTDPSMKPEEIDRLSEASPTEMRSEDIQREGVWSMLGRGINRVISGDESLLGIRGTPTPGTPTTPTTPAPKSEAAKPTGRMRVKRKSDGETGWIDAKDFDPKKYEELKPKKSSLDTSLFQPNQQFGLTT